MARPPLFGERTPKVVEFLKMLSEFHRENETPLSLTYMSKRVRKIVPGLRPAPKPYLGWYVARARDAARRDAKRKVAGPFRARAEADGALAESKVRGLDVFSRMVRPQDPLRHIIYKLCKNKKYRIWFGKP